MIRILGTLFAALFGLAFGSFLNVCLSRWPQGESIVRPRSHCRRCNRTLTWWENIPLLSWLALGGRCRTCRAVISWRYPAVELAVGVLWAGCWLRFAWPALLDGSNQALAYGGVQAVGFALFFWVLVGLASLDAEYLWLPDAVTLPAIAIGVLFQVVRAQAEFPAPDHPRTVLQLLEGCALSIFAAAALVLFIRWSYWLVRRREGMGLGDAKLMALLGAWLGLPQALLAFALSVVLGYLAALALMAVPSTRRGSQRWATVKLPLGTFLCIGGMVSAGWGRPILAAYLRLLGF